MIDRSVAPETFVHEYVHWIFTPNDAACGSFVDYDMEMTDKHANKPNPDGDWAFFAASSDVSSPHTLTLITSSGTSKTEFYFKLKAQTHDGEWWWDDAIFTTIYIQDCSELYRR